MTDPECVDGTHKFRDGCERLCAPTSGCVAELIISLRHEIERLRIYEDVMLANADKLRAMEPVVAAAILKERATCTQASGCGCDAGHGRACPRDAAGKMLASTVEKYIADKDAR